MVAPVLHSNECQCQACTVFFQHRLKSVASVEGVNALFREVVTVRVSSPRKLRKGGKRNRPEHG